MPRGVFSACPEAFSPHAPRRETGQGVHQGVHPVCICMCVMMMMMCDELIDDGGGVLMCVGTVLQEQTFWAEPPPPWGEAPRNVHLVMSVREIVHPHP